MIIKTNPDRDSASDDPNPIHGRAQRPLFWLVLGVALLAAWVFMKRMIAGSMIVENGDDTEKFLAAQLINHGHHLYRDIILQHGPVPFIVAHLYSLLISPSDFSYIRVTEGIFALISTAALFYCPALRTTASKLLAVAIYLLLLSSVWVLAGFSYLLYHPIGGFSLVIVLSQFVVPAVVGERPRPFGLAASGAACAVAFFSAYTLLLPSFLFLMSAVILTAPSSNKELLSLLKHWLSGAFLLSALIILWLLVFGDVKGFIAYHIYATQRFVPETVGFVPLHILFNLIFSFSADRIIHTFALSLLAASFFIFAIHRKGASSRERVPTGIGAAIVLVAGFMVINPRSEIDFKDAGFVICSFALFALSVGIVLQNWQHRYCLSGLARLVVLAGSVIFLSEQVGQYAIPFIGFSREELFSTPFDVKPVNGGIYEFVRSITKKEGDLLSLPWDPVVYIQADRLPASGHFAYLPWQAAYNRNPIFGIRTDICADIATRQPAVIYFFNWRVWDKYSIEDYAPCILSSITERYSPLGFNSFWYIRNDVLAGIKALPPSDLESQSETSIGKWMKKVMRPGTPLTAFSPITLFMTPANDKRRAALKRIGLLIETYPGRTTGDAELRLEGPDGLKFVQRFTLSDVVNNKYRYFDLTLGQYSTGEIVSATGEGISTWESHLENGDIYTCMIYEYADGGRSYTPSCPVM